MIRLPAVVAVVVLAGTGCASQLSMVKAENHRLTEQVTQLRSDKRRADRKVRELENELAVLNEHGGGGGGGGAHAAAPVLPVEVLGPAVRDDGLEPGQRIVGFDDDGTAIIYEGDAASGKAATYDDSYGGDGSDDDDDDDTAPPPPKKSRPRASHADADRIASQDKLPKASDRGNPEAAEQYKAAVDLLRGGHHDDAVALLRDFLQRFPDHDYADNAQYWLGEAYYDRKDYTKALAEFRVAVDKYPRGNKVPDALLKVGYCYLALGQSDKGRFALEQVVAIYPKTEPAALATKRLETIGQ